MRLKIGIYDIVPIPNSSKAPCFTTWSDDGNLMYPILTQKHVFRIVTFLLCLSSNASEISPISKHSLQVVKEMLPHLRPHPTQVPEWENLDLKRRISSQSNAYTVALNNRTTTDVDIRKDGVKDYSNTGKLLAESIKPVIFTLCYDVRFDYENDYQLRHVVCCVKVSNTIYMCDMRNQDDIPHLKERIKAGIDYISGRNFNYVNMADNGRKHIYLQRNKGKHEFGWCIAWSLYFLEHLMRFDGQNIISQLRQLYNTVDRVIEQSKSNYMIEQWYQVTLQNAFRV